MSDPSLIGYIGDLAARLGQTEVKEVPLSGIRCRVYNSANISIANNTVTSLTFDSEEFDTDGMHSTSVATDRITCVHAGAYLVWGCVEWAQASGGRRDIRIAHSAKGAIAVVEIGSAADAVAFPVQIVTTLTEMAVGDYLQLQVYHTQGAPLNVKYSANYSPYFQAVRIA